MKKTTVIIFIALISVISILNVFNENIVFSENENRYLAQFPELSAENIFDGSFSEDFEAYIQDQMFMRPEFIELKALFNLNVFRKLQNNDVYIADDTLVNQFILNDTSVMVDNIDVINSFEHDLDVMLIPTHAAFSNEIDRLSYNTDQKSLLEKAEEKLTKNYINVYYDLAVNDNNYFSTDHHWNHHGANTAYDVYCENKEIEALDYNFEKVSDDFKGSLYSKSGLFSQKGESLYSPVEIDSFDLEVIIDDEHYDSVFFEEKLNEKDKYTYYLGGNHSDIKIINKDCDTESSILVIKDSYANIYIPLLIPHFRNIHVIDLRYYHQPVSELIEEDDIDEVLLLYNVESFVTDENIRFLR